jgi:hypothetical protein
LNRARRIHQGIPLSSPILDANLVWISDVAHLFATAEKLMAAVEMSLPNVRTYLIRSNTKATISRVDWAKYFPSLLVDDMKRQPTEESIVASLATIGAQVIESCTVDESFELPRDEYIAYYESRPFSGIRLLDDDQFIAGMKHLISDTSGNAFVSRVVTRQLIIARRQRV